MDARTKHTFNGKPAKSATQMRLALAGCGIAIPANSPADPTRGMPDF